MVYRGSLALPDPPDKTDNPDLVAPPAQPEDQSQTVRPAPTAPKASPGQTVRKAQQALPAPKGLKVSPGLTVRTAQQAPPGKMAPVVREPP